MYMYQTWYMFASRLSIMYLYMQTPTQAHTRTYTHTLSHKKTACTHTCKHAVMNVRSMQYELWSWLQISSMQARKIRLLLDLCIPVLLAMKLMWPGNVDEVEQKRHWTGTNLSSVSGRRAQTERNVTGQWKITLHTLMQTHTCTHVCAPIHWRMS